MKRPAVLVITFLLLALLWPSASPAERHSAPPQEIPAVLWQDPGPVSARDLYFGAGSPTRAPAPPFVFLSENKKGRSPKFRVVDANRVEWSVKLGPEAQPETVSTRLVWSVGYFVEEAYHFKRVCIEKLPRLSRGQKYVEEPGVVLGARFKPHRKDVKRGAIWDWNKNPFVGTRELDGLKVLMVLLNNYDTFDDNNRILITKHPREAHYVVSDLGATLGRTGGWGTRRSEGNVEDYISTPFILGVKDGMIRFDYHARVGGIGWFTILYPHYFLSTVRMEKTFRAIPAAHVRWIATLLSSLTNKQLDDAFRAADYDAATREKYVHTLSKRIEDLSQPPFLVQASKLTPDRD